MRRSVLCLSFCLNNKPLELCKNVWMQKGKRLVKGFGFRILIGQTIVELQVQISVRLKC